MKKLLVLLALVVVLIATPVLAVATYTATVTMTESSGNTYTENSWILNQNNTLLASQGYISSTGLDVLMTDGGVNVPCMLTGTTTLFANTLSANTSKTLNETFGNTPATSMPIIVGNGGYITTTDNVALEPGNNFSIVANGYINTTAGAGLNIVYKSGALQLYVDSSTPGTIDATTYNTSSTVSIAGTGNSSDIYSGSMIAVGENFNSGFSSGLTILSDSISLEKTGSPTGTISCNVYKQSDGSLIGTLGTLDSSTLTGSLVFYTFNSTPVYLGTTTNFIIAAYYNGGNSGNCIVAGINGTNPYANGQYDTLTGSTWTPVSANDAACQNMTYAVSHAISVTGISSGVHTITLSETTASSGTLSLQVDSGVPATVTSAGSVFDNANNWLLNQNNVMPYMTSYVYTVGATEVIKYQPVTIISGTALPNLDSGGSYPGVITYGTNPAGVTIGVSVPTGSGSTVVVPAAGTPPNVAAPSSGQNISGTSTGTTGSTFWFYGLFKSLVDQYNTTNVPNPPPHQMSMGWLWMAISFVATVGSAILAAKTGSMLFLGVTFCGICGLLCSATIFPWWVFYITCIIVITFFIFQRVNSVGG